MVSVNREGTLLRLALITKECPEPPSLDDVNKHLSFCGCNGTGRVSLIPGLREPCAPCDGIGYWGYTKDFPPLVCKICGGRGWNVTTNSETIAQGLWPLLIELPQKLPMAAHVAHYTMRMAAGHFDDAWEAAAKALEVAGLLEKETP